MPNTAIGAPQIITSLDKLAQALSPASIQSILNDGGKLGEAEAKGRARVRTGAMRDSTKWEQNGPYSGTLGSYVDYAIYNELGTYKMSAQPFITPGAEAIVDYILSAIAEAVAL